MHPKKNLSVSPLSDILEFNGLSLYMIYDRALEACTLHLIHVLEKALVVVTC